MELFKSRFWPDSSEDLHLSFADSALNVGGRRPLKPSIKDGVVIQLGSRHNFSESLFALDRETGPLRRLQSCSYKRVSVERHFRQVIDQIENVSSPSPQTPKSPKPPKGDWG